MNKEEARQRIQQLSEDLREHNHRYYVEARPTISDYDFDMLLEKLIRLETEQSRWMDMNRGYRLIERYVGHHRNPWFDLVQTSIDPSTRNTLWPNIREMITFPMNQQAEDLLMAAPCEVEPKHLTELHIRLDLPQRQGVNPAEQGTPGEQTGAFERTEGGEIRQAEEPDAT